LIKFFKERIRAIHSHAFAKKLADAGIENTGVKLDPALNKLYVAFKDPDRISWEYYMK
jgi:hypothetical protein